MKNLLKLELRKMRKQKSFYICTIIIVGLLFLSVKTAEVLTQNPEIANQFSASGIDIVLGALNSSSFLMIAGIFVALCVCDDYEQQTVKNIYARGYSRKQVYLSKLISVWIGTTIMFAITTLCAFLFSKSYFEASDFQNIRFVGILAVQYAACMANLGLCFLVSSLLRKNGSSIAATIVAPMIINMLLGMIDSFIKFENFSLTNVWLSSFMGDLSKLSVSSERLMICLAASLAYIIVFAFIGIFSHRKIEL